MAVTFALLSGGKERKDGCDDLQVFWPGIQKTLERGVVKKKVFIELMKKGKTDKMESEYSENMFLMRYCIEKVSCRRTSETTLAHLLLGCTRWPRMCCRRNWCARGCGGCAS